MQSFRNYVVLYTVCKIGWGARGSRTLERTPQVQLAGELAHLHEHVVRVLHLQPPRVVRPQRVLRREQRCARAPDGLACAIKNWDYSTALYFA